MRHMLVLALVGGLWLAGCSGEEAPALPVDAPPVSPAPAPVPPVTAPAAEAPLPAAPPAPSDASSQPRQDLLPVPADLPANLRRVHLKAGEIVSEQGLYFLAMETGAMEGWLSVSGDDWVRPSASGDDRWVNLTTGSRKYLVHRETGQAYAWATDKLRLIADAPGWFLFEELESRHGTGRIFVLDGEFRLVSAFRAGSHPFHPPDVCFSPDGKMIALLPRNVAAGGSAEAPVFLAELSSGNVRAAGPALEPYGGVWTRAALGTCTARELQVIFSRDDLKGGPFEEQDLVRRFSWQGELLSETYVPGSRVVSSPDGRYLAWRAGLGGFSYAVVIQEAATGLPVLRVPGAMSPRWLSGSRHLLLSTDVGPKLLSLTGEISPAPPLPANVALPPRLGVDLAPDNPSLFAIGPLVLDTSGRVLRSVRTAEGIQVSHSYWGQSSKELHFEATGLHGGDGEYAQNPLPLPPKVQWPPFSDRLILQVMDPEGQCRNLRQSPSAEGPVIRCLPPGTKVTVNGAGGIASRTDPFAWTGDQLWISVETAKGEKGWLAASLESLTWDD